MQETPPFAFPTEQLPDEAICSQYLDLVEAGSAVLPAERPLTEEQLLFEIGAENCLLRYGTARESGGFSDPEMHKVAVLVDESVAGRMCASVRRERSAGSACTDSLSPDPMIMIFHGYSSEPIPYDIVVVDPQRRLGALRIDTLSNVPVESQDIQDQGLWIYVELWDEPDAMEVLDQNGNTISDLSNRIERLANAQAAAEAMKQVPPEAE